MRLPRDLDPTALIKALARLGHAPIRQSGSHVRPQTLQRRSHASAIPTHAPLRVGTLSAILADVARAQELTRESLLSLLFEG